LFFTCCFQPKTGQNIKMPFGILNDKHMETVPGTALLEDLKRDQFDGVDTSHLKKSADGKHILVPQPSDDPRDPLNWPMMKKQLCFWTLLLMAGIAGACGPLVSSGYVAIARDTNASVNSVAASNGYLLLGLGVAMFFQSAIAVKFGRRPVFIVSAFILFTGFLWSGAAKTDTSFTVSRIYQGVGMASYEALVTATIGDLFFVHQRGKAIVAWGFAIISGISVAPLVNGYIIESSLGWKWCFWIVGIATGIFTIMVILFVPETVYDRDAAYETDAGASAATAAKVNAAADIVDHKQVGDDEKGEIDQAEHILEAAHIRHNYLPAKTFVQELAPWSGYVSPVSFWKLFLRPFPIALSPVVFCGFWIYGVTTAWIVTLSVSSSIIFGGPPLLFNAKQVGLMSVGPFIASIIGAFVAGPFLDWCSVSLAKRNKGVFEPEFRLVLLIPMFFICGAGFLGWYGILKNDVAGWIGPEVMYSIIYFGNGLGSSAIVNYTIDVHRKTSAEAFTIINFAKNMLIYGITQFVVDWILAWTIPTIMLVLTFFMCGSILFGVPLWIFGKRFRSFIARNPKLYLDQH